MLKIEDVSEKNLEDIFKICKHAFKICPHNEFDYLLYKKGLTLKEQWLKDMIKQHGPCAKIVYKDGKPLAQIQFCLEETIPYISNPRKKVVSILCTYSPLPDTQRTGIATALVKNLLEESRSGLSCTNGLTCHFLVTLPFPSEGETALTKFYQKNGFRQGFKEMYFENNGKYVPRETPDYSPIPEDLDRTIILYNPACEWGYFYAYKVEKFIHDIHPSHLIEVYNIWENPEEYIKRTLHRVTAGRAIVKGQVMRGGIFWTDREAFQRELEEALNK